MEEVRRLLDQLVAAGAPGAAAWIHDGHGGVQAASGVADLRARPAMRPGLHFRAGSLTKSLVATVVLQLGGGPAVAAGHPGAMAAGDLALWRPGHHPPAAQPHQRRARLLGGRRTDDRYGLGLLEAETPAGRLVGNVGGIPGFLSIVLSTPDGRRQLGVMINVLAAPDPVYEAFTQVFRELGARLLWRTP